MRIDSNVDDKVYASAIRATVCNMFVHRGDGHIGGCFSMSDLLAILFNHYIRDGKDWFVLSKGHAGPAYYAVLYLNHKFGEEHLPTLNSNGTILPSHPDRNLTPGVECSTGSLGQGISQAVGIAYANKIAGNDSWVYCVVGDGELNEGQTYEALEFASNKKLNNLIIFIDKNNKQVDGLVKDVSCDYDYIKLFEGLNLTSKIINGHNFAEIDQSIEDIEQNLDDKCHVLVLETIKGKGISYFENIDNCHHMNFTNEELLILKQYLDENMEAVKNVLENTR